MKTELCLILPLLLLVTVGEALKQTDLEIQVNQCSFSSFITRQRSCGKVIFSVASVCLAGGGESLYMAPACPPYPVQGPSTDPLYNTPAPAPALSSDMFKLVHCVACTVCRQVSG